MSYLIYNQNTVPSGWRKILYLNWPLILLPSAVAVIGFLLLYSVADASPSRWALPQMKRFAVGLAGMIAVAMVPIWHWRRLAVPAYLAALALLLAVEFIGQVGSGAQRWIDLGPIRVQPSEMAKIALVMALAAYYDALEPDRVSRPGALVLPLVMIAAPVALVLAQPDLGTAALMALGGAAVMFAAGVHWMYFGAVTLAGAGGAGAVWLSRGTPWQLLRDYQYARIDTFLDPSRDPLGAGYHITQAKIALGSGGWSGRGFMQGTQTQLSFLPEQQTDFIFTTLAEEFGFVGSLSLLALYLAILGFCTGVAIHARERFPALLVIGIAFAFFLYFAINMGMVMGLVPVVGAPLPLVSYGGSAMLVLMLAFGLVQSAHVHRPRGGE